MLEAATVHAVPGGRLHLRHGPIDVVLRAWGARSAVAVAYEAVAARFPTVLPELAAELPELRKAMVDAPRVRGAVARRMVAACRPHRRLFVTPMAAVAGAVADELLAAMTGAAALDKAFVNDGGDIAIHLAPGEAMAIGVVADLSGGPAPPMIGQVTLRPEDRIGGVATSGWRGRSFSLGIADSATVLAGDAAGADAAATLVANAVDLLGHGAVRRAPARALDPDSDLGDRPVTVAVGPLDPGDVAAALSAGRARAEEMRAAGLVRAVVLALRRETAVVGGPLDGPALGGAAFETAAAPE